MLIMSVTGRLVFQIIVMLSLFGKIRVILELNILLLTATVMLVLVQITLTENSMLKAQVVVSLNLKHQAVVMQELN